MNNPLLGDGAIDAEAIADMKKFLSGKSPQTRFAAYQNHLLGEAGTRQIRFLAVGPDCTHKEPPARYPDSHLGTGWRHVFVGYANLNTGKVDPIV